MLLFALFCLMLPLCISFIWSKLSPKNLTYWYLTLKIFSSSPCSCKVHLFELKHWEVWRFNQLLNQVISHELSLSKQKDRQPSARHKSGSLCIATKMPLYRSDEMSPDTWPRCLPRAQAEWYRALHDGWGLTSNRLSRHQSPSINLLAT